MTDEQELIWYRLAVPRVRLILETTAEALLAGVDVGATLRLANTLRATAILLVATGEER